MAMAFSTMPTRLATMVIITENLWRNRDLLDLKISDLRSQILDLRSDPGATWSSNKHEQKQQKHYKFNIFSLVLQKRNKEVFKYEF